MADLTHPAHRWTTVRTRLCKRAPGVSQKWSASDKLLSEAETHPWLLHSAHVLKDLLVQRCVIVATSCRVSFSAQRFNGGRTEKGPASAFTYCRHLLMIERFANHDAFPACPAGKHAARFRRPDHLRSSAGRNHLDEFFEICARHSTDHQFLVWLCGFWIRRQVLTSDVEDSVSADRLSCQLDPLTEAGILVDLDVETVQPQHVQVLHGRDLVCRRKVENARSVMVSIFKERSQLRARATQKFGLELLTPRVAATG